MYIISSYWKKTLITSCVSAFCIRRAHILLVILCFKCTAVILLMLYTIISIWKTSKAFYCARHSLKNWYFYKFCCGNLSLPVLWHWTHLCLYVQKCNFQKSNFCNWLSNNLILDTHIVWHLFKHHSLSFIFSVFYCPLLEVASWYRRWQGHCDQAGGQWGTTCRQWEQGLNLRGFLEGEL